MNSLASLKAGLAPERAEKSAPKAADPADAGTLQAKRGFRETLRAALAPKPAEEANLASDADVAQATEENASVKAAATPTAENATENATEKATEKVAAEETPDAPHPSAAEAVVANAANAMNAARPQPPRDPNRVERTKSDLDPVFRTRLDRVIERMAALGHKVEIVETSRSAARQDFLFAQGRTRPGPVVTWTRDSNHEVGLAADVVIDGRYDNPAGYAALAQVARAEGLRTLGARDPGHIELPGGAGRAALSRNAAAAMPLAAMPAASASTPSASHSAMAGGVAEVARVAEVAQVAQVAPLAAVAPVATVAVPGAGPAVAGPAVAAPQVRGAGEGGDRPGTGEEKGDRQPAPDGGPAGHFAADTGAPARVPLDARVGDARPVLGAAALDRLTRVLDLQDAAAARPMTQMLLRVENANGGTDSIRVGLRDGAVGASIDLGSRLDQTLPGRVEELQRALQKHGLELDSVRVRSVRNDGADAARLAALPDADAIRAPNTRSGSDSGWQRDRQPSQRDTNDSRSDTPRHRSHREQPGGKNA